MSIRTERVGAEIRQALAEYLQRQRPDYLDGMVTITAVRVSADLSVAKVYVSIWNSKVSADIVVKRLNTNQPELRSVVAHQVRLRKTPELRFYRDDTLDTAEHIDELIRKVREEDDRRAAERGDLDGGEDGSDNEVSDREQGEREE